MDAPHQSVAEAERNVQHKRHDAIATHCADAAASRDGLPPAAASTPSQARDAVGGLRASEHADGYGRITVHCSGPRTAAMEL
jgi:hypothetical protein